MVLRSLSSWLKGSKVSRQSSRKRPPSRRSAFGFEPLENRALLAALTVNSLDDLAVDLTDAKVTLCDAIYAANNDLQVAPEGPTASGADTISFDPALFASGPQTINLSIIGDDDEFQYGDSAFKITTPVAIQGPTGAGGLTLAGPGDTGNEDTTMRLFLVTPTGNLTLGHLTLTGGRADDDLSFQSSLGGAILNNQGTLKLTNSTLTGNSAASVGGGIFNVGTLTVTNSTLTGNSAGAHAGGIGNTGTLTVTNSTLTGNSAVLGDGGIVNGGTGTLNNTIVAGNMGLTTPSDIFGGVDTDNSFNNLIGDPNSSGGLTHGDNGNIVGDGSGGVIDLLTVFVDVNTDGKIDLSDLADNGGPTKTYALRAGSPAINAGDNSKAVDSEGNPLTTDQRGFARIIGTVDIGAVEAIPLNLVVDTLADENDGNFAATDLSLREAIFLAELNPDPQTITFDPDLFTGGAQTMNLSIIGDDDATYGDSAFKITTPVAIQAPTGAGGLTLAGPAYTGNADTIMRLFLVNGTGNLTLDHLTLTGGWVEVQADGQANDGGAIYNGGTLKLTNSTLSGNTSYRDGGGIWNSGTLTVTNSTLSGNKAIIGGITGGDGGGIWNSGTLTVTNSTLSGNKAFNGGGGGIWNSGTLTVTNSTLTRNYASTSDGGSGIYADSGSLTLNNTIVAGNTGAYNIFGSVVTTNSFNNLIGTQGTGGLTNGVNGNQVGVAVASVLDPNLADNGGPTKTHALLTGSTAINAGNNSKVPAGVTTDQRGYARIVGGRVDIGAFEVQNQAPTDIELDDSNVDENQSPGTAVGTLSTIDPDAVDTFMYELVSGSGDSDNDLFEIVGNELKTKASFDFESDAQYSILVRSTDSGGLSVDKVFEILVSDVNEAPTLSVPADQIAFEDVDQEIKGLSVNDPDGDSLTVTLNVSHGKLTLGSTDGLSVTGNASGALTLSGSSVELNLALASLVYRANLNYSGADTLSINVSDGSLSTSSSLAITVKSWAQQADDLAAQVDALVAAGVLNDGQGNSLKLNLKDNNGDAGKVQAFLNEVAALLYGGILTQAHADALLGPGNILLLSVTRR